MSREVKQEQVKDKLKKSTTLAIVIFVVLFLIYNSILQQFLKKEISYMSSLVDYSFKILMLYIGGNKLINVAGNLGKGKK